MNPNALAAREALRQFRVIFGAVRQHFQAVEKACGVSGAQIWAMAALRQTPGMKVSELAQTLSIHASTASNLLDKIEKSGLIRRERNSVDQRVVRRCRMARGRAVRLQRRLRLALPVPDGRWRGDRCVLPVAGHPVPRPRRRSRGDRRQPGGDDQRRLGGLAVEAGVQIRHLRASVPTLEDVFARAVGER